MKTVSFSFLPITCYIKPHSWGEFIGRAFEVFTRCSAVTGFIVNTILIKITFAPEINKRTFVCITVHMCLVVVVVGIVCVVVVEEAVISCEKSKVMLSVSRLRCKMDFKALLNLQLA